jgi:hypothetical protein
MVNTVPLSRRPAAQGDSRASVGGGRRACSGPGLPNRAVPMIVSIVAVLLAAMTTPRTGHTIQISAGVPSDVMSVPTVRHGTRSLCRVVKPVAWWSASGKEAGLPWTIRFWVVLLDVAARWPQSVPERAAPTG